MKKDNGLRAAIAKDMKAKPAPKAAPKPKGRMAPAVDDWGMPILPQATNADFAKIKARSDADAKAAAAKPKAPPKPPADLNKSEKREHNLNSLRGRRNFEKTIKGR